MIVNIRHLAIFSGLLVNALLSGCGDSGGDGPDGGGGGGGNAGGGGDLAPVTCSGEFARVMPPYAPNTSISEWGGFLADGQGLVFSAIADTLQTSSSADYPPLLMSSDLDGNVSTLYTPAPGSLIGPIFAVDSDDLYVVIGLLSPAIMRMPRAGGEPVAVTTNRLWAGPVTDGELFYYAARPGSGEEGSFADTNLFALDPATDTSTLLAARGNTTIGAIAVDGDTLYWVETGDILSDDDYELFQMPAAGGTAELVMTLPNGTALGSFRVVDEVAIGSTITESFSLEVHRTPFGGTPEVVATSAGLPMIIAGDRVYYGSSSGLVRNSLAFDAPSVVAGTAGESVYSLAAGPTDLWYSLGPCIYRTAL